MDSPLVGTLENLILKFLLVENIIHFFGQENVDGKSICEDSEACKNILKFENKILS
jgi:hypothetical protein